jgi:hypothetical protein
VLHRRVAEILPKLVALTAHVPAWGRDAFVAEILLRPEAVGGLGLERRYPRNTPLKVVFCGVPIGLRSAMPCCSCQRLLDLLAGSRDGCPEAHLGHGFTVRHAGFWGYLGLVGCPRQQLMSGGEARTIDPGLKRVLPYGCKRQEYSKRLGT